MTTPRLVAFGGSLRKDSFNQKLVALAAEGARAAGAEVDVLRLADFPMPILNEDEERASGPSDGARRFKAALKAADGLLIASPEYNSGYSAALKNALDWASRKSEGEAPLAVFQGKVAGLLAASPGAGAGLRGLVQLRMVLGNIGVIVLPEQFALAKAHEAFEADGRLKDAKALASAQAIGRRVAEVAATLKARA